MRLYGELHRFLPALAFIEGARITEVKVNHRARQFGSSKYGIDRTFRVLMDLLTVWFMKRFLTRPMYVFGFGGLLAIAASLITSTYLLVIKVMGGDIANRPLLTPGGGAWLGWHSTVLLRTTGRTADPHLPRKPGSPDLSHPRNIARRPSRLTDRGSGRRAAERCDRSGSCFHHTRIAVPQRLAQQGQHRTVSPSGGQTNSAQTLLGSSLQISLETTLQGKSLQGTAWRRPRLQRKLSGFPISCRLNHQFQLGTIDLCDAAGIRAGKHRLDRLPAQPEHHREQHDGTGEENVLHAD